MSRVTSSYGVSHPVLQTILVSGLYLGAGWLGLQALSAPGQIALVWLPSGIALAAVLIWGFRVLPGVALGAALVPAVLGAQPGVIAAHVLGATGAAALGGLALQELDLRHGFHRVREVFYFVIVAVLSPLVAATAVTLGATLTGTAPWSAGFILLRDAWIGHTVGIIIATPLLLAWAGPVNDRPSAASVREASVLLLGLLALTAATWSPLLPVNTEALLLYAVAPFFLWAAMRFRFRIVATATTIGWAGAITGTLLGYGPFTATAEPLLSAYAYLGVMSLTTYVIAGLVHEQASTARSLNESQQKFRDLIDSAPDVILQVDRGGRIRFRNRDSYGASRVPIQGRFHDAIQPAYRDQVRQRVEMVYWNATPSLIEAPVGKGLNTRWYSFQIGPLRRGERVEGVMVIGQDVTERKDAEAKLRESQDRLRTFFDGSPVPIAIFDLEGRFLEHNPPVVRLLDAGDVDLRDLDLPTILAAEDKAQVWEDFRSLVTGAAERFQNDARIIQREGDQVWVRLQASLIRDAAGDPVFVVGTMEDIGAQLRAVQAEELAATRATKIGELEEVSQWKSQLLSIASHELRNPLTPMHMQLDLLRRGVYGDLNERQLQAVDKLTRQGERLAELVSGIQDVARIQNGRLQVTPRRSDLNAMIHSVVEEFEDPAREWGLVLEEDVEDGIEAVADADRLQQVVINLLSNACKFTPRGGRVTVRMRRQGDAIEVAVADTGPGLDQQQITRLFHAFSQVHDVTGGDRKGGLGMGLYIAKGIVEAHGGVIWCESGGAGTGTTFAFRVPCGDLQAARWTDAVSSATSRGRDAQGPRHGNKEVDAAVDALLGRPGRDAPS